MISFLEGKIETKEKNSLILNVNSIGYRIFVSIETLSKMPQAGSSIKVFTAMEVKEDSMELYGFLTKEEADFYNLLRTASGVGPKTALALLSLAPVSSIASAIVNKDINFLTKVSGVGTKVAEKIILELKDKVEQKGLHGARHSEKDSDLLEALTKMGYGVKESVEALSHVPSTIVDEQGRLKEALKMLNRK